LKKSGGEPIMIRFLSNQNAASRKSLMGYLLFNLGKSERQYFEVSYNSTLKAYFITTKGKANAVYAVNHTIAFEDLMQTIKTAKTVRIGFGENVAYVGGSVNVAVDAGGGVTVPASISTTGDVEAYVSRLGNASGVTGTNGQNISDPISVILAHELLGHARLMLIGQPSGQPEAIQSENDYRRGRGLEERQ
jgi:hypothetical protein